MTNQLREVVADALLPCPFCGSADIGESIGKHGNGAEWRYIECADCSACAELEYWNERATLPTQSAGVEERAREAMSRIESLLSDFELIQRLKPGMYEEMDGNQDGRYLSRASVLDTAREIREELPAIAAALRTPASEGDGGRVVADLAPNVPRPWSANEHDPFEILDANGDPIGSFYGPKKDALQAVAIVVHAVNALTTPPTQQEARAVDDEMVRRARRAYGQAEILNGSDPLGWMRAALTAALQPGAKP